MAIMAQVSLMAQRENHFRYDVTHDDIEVVRRLTAGTGFFSPDEVDVAVELVDERLNKGIGSGYHFVFINNHGTTLGYACYGPIACTVGSFDLYWIVVDPQCQRQGIGQSLLSDVERLIRSQGGRHIYIETSNRGQYAPTRRFYERCHYECVAILPDFYHDGDDKVIYRRKLEPIGRALDIATFH
jgi:ribosomal protein S18 acetylase RimI-like enzyme